MSSIGDSLGVAIPIRGVMPDSAGAVRTLVILPSDLAHLEVSRGVSRRAAVMRGVYVGMAIGGAFVASSVNSVANSEYAFLAAPYGALIIFGAGGVGGLIGSAFTVETWERLR